jgi:hypothetical protein
MLAPAQTAFNAASGTLRQVIPGHYVYSAMNGGRPFSSGIIATNEGAIVVDAHGPQFGSVLHRPFDAVDHERCKWRFY